ncbi:helix-turn-helix domain-containing protein [Paraburkholderia sp. D15]|uniref:helix-turn-helix domain-containing protein n=1 Tax=Paraburkholderia sp. D15 TaxID=2880218 RepID=UPI002478D7A6|nr:helix-turn-helix domain-containing protein [Paraburkholderia sp. D15]WGS52491.1 helix-turn-helix domain-containing protein [Paraburkholderia sp. D15]
MDALVTAAARALAAGDPFGALNHVALRDDAPSLALRGIAMAQLGDLPRARALVRSAARAFGPRAPLARARCVLAEAEIALASRDLRWPVNTLDAARATLEAHGDRLNAAHARYLDVRRLVLTGRLDDAERALARLDPTLLPPPLRTVHELMSVGIALRRWQATAARHTLARAAQAARLSRIPALLAEVDGAASMLNTPAAHLLMHGETQGQTPGKTPGQTRELLLDDIEALLASNVLVVDACRRVVHAADTTISLASRPVLFTLARTLAEAWPADVSRDTLVARAFRAKHADESQRARLRVEIGRLRALLVPLAGVRATPRGFALAPRDRGNAAAARVAVKVAADVATNVTTKVAVLAPPVDERHAALLACLADGESWASSALALALDASQRTIQRALDSLAAAGKVQSVGQGRARRWMMPPIPGFATALLLPPLFPDD